MSDKKYFSKKALSFEEQADLLLSRGLLCSDKQKLICSLRHYNYYRLSGYCLSFEAKRHQFLTGITFEDIASAYEFDRKLRKIVMEGLELLEIQLRTSIAYHLALKYGPFAHENKDNLFCNDLNFEKWLDTIHKAAEESKEIFVLHFKKNYKDFPRLPIWVLVEILPFGSLSHLFSFLKKEDQKTLAQQFNIPLTVLKSWLHTFSYLRNTCAHHGRLYDKTLSIKPKTYHCDVINFPPEKIIYSLLSIRTMLRASCFQQSIVLEWMKSIENLFINHPNIPNFYNKVGSPKLLNNWLDTPIWK